MGVICVLCKSIGVYVPQRHPRMPEQMTPTTATTPLLTDIRCGRSFARSGGGRVCVFVAANERTNERQSDRVFRAGRPHQAGLLIARW